MKRAEEFMEMAGVEMAVWLSDNAVELRDEVSALIADNASLRMQLAQTRVARGQAEFHAAQASNIARVATDAAKTLAAGLEEEQAKNESLQSALDNFIAQAMP